MIIKERGGTVSLDYTTLVVTGSATTFGQVGAAATGDVIRFGPRGEGGNAVIVGIASTQRNYQSHPQWVSVVLQLLQQVSKLVSHQNLLYWIVVGVKACYWL
jgi:hypothetical protein